VERLAAAGHLVRVASRRQPDQPLPAHAEWTRLDLATGSGLTEAVTEVDVVVHCATSGRGRADLAAARRLVDAAREAGVRHLVYISIVGVDRVPLGYYQAKLAVERLLAESGIGWTVLRTTQFHDLISAFFRLQRRLPVTFAIAGTRFQPIEVREVADRLAELAAAPPAGRVADLGGPEVLDCADLARTYLRAVGRHRPVLPLWLPGAIFAGYRRGGHLAPDRADGRITYAEHLATS
jgi:uncharacterized protein YbjT (DUF2867 family)